MISLRQLFKNASTISAVLIFGLQASGVFAGTLQSSVKKSKIEETNPAFATQNARLIQQKLALEDLQAAKDAEHSRRGAVQDLPTADPKAKLPPSKIMDVNLEAGYIVSSQFLDPASAANGAINNVYGAPTWIVPRENALAILGLLEAYNNTRNSDYLKRAELAADYLVRVQDSDGAWFDQYSYASPVVFSKSPTQTAEVMMALDKLGYSPSRYNAMKKGAEYLLSLQNVANKGGVDDGLVSGGKKDDGTFNTWRWASDNSFAYLALKHAQEWAKKSGDRAFTKTAGTAAERVLNGINRYLYVSDVNDADYGVWRRVIDENDTAVDPGYHEWINYAPQMLDLPALGVGNARVGEWIHNTLQKSDGSVVWDDRYFSNRKSPGYSFQASLVWLDLGQTQYANAAWDWASNSGLWQKTPDANGITGSWVDWTEGATSAQWWERFIDTSFYAVSVLNGGYNFNK